MKLTTMSEKWGEFRILDLVRMYISDEKLINTEKFQVSSFYRFWAIEGKLIGNHTPN